MQLDQKSVSNMENATNQPYIGAKWLCNIVKAKIFVKSVVTNTALR